MSEIAHLGPVELLTSDGEASRRLLSAVLGIRADPGGLECRVAAVRAAGLGGAWTDGADRGRWGSERSRRRDAARTDSPCRATP